MSPCLAFFVAGRFLWGDALFARYRYVEFAAREMPHFRNLVINVKNVGRYADSYGRYNVYTSMYFYLEKVFEYMKGNIRAGRASISAYDGLIYANYLFIDIDAKRLDAALDVARKILLCLYDKWNCGKNDVTMAFSGNKGFHIGIDTGVFGRLLPSGNLNIVFSEIRREISQICALTESERELIDFAINDRTRLWRLINTINAKSGLFKIALHPAELMRLGVDEIKGMARQRKRVLQRMRAGLFRCCGRV